MSHAEAPREIERLGRVELAVGAFLIGVSLLFSGQNPQGAEASLAARPTSPGVGIPPTPTSHRGDETPSPPQIAVYLPLVPGGNTQ